MFHKNSKIIVSVWLVVSVPWTADQSFRVSTGVRFPVLLLVFFCFRRPTVCRLRVASATLYGQMLRRQTSDHQGINRRNLRVRLLYRQDNSDTLSPHQVNLSLFFVHSELIYRRQYMSSKSCRFSLMTQDLKQIQ